MLPWRWVSQETFERVVDRLKRLTGVSWKAIKEAIARYRKLRRKTRRIERGFRFQYLCFENLEDRRLLSVTTAYWDGSQTGAWVAPFGQTSHWLVNGQPAPWADGDAAVISGPTGKQVSISISGQVNPYSIAFDPGASYDISGGTIGLSGNTSIIVQVTATAQIGSEIVDTSSSAPGQFVSAGAGMLILGSPANNYSGGTDVAYGSTVQLVNNATLGAPTAPLQLYGTLDVNGCGLTVGSLTGGGTVENSSGNLVTFTVATDSALDAFSGDITGAVNLEKDGSGVLALGGTDIYTGDTHVVSGTIQLASANALPNPAGRVGNNTGKPESLLVDQGAVLDLDGNNAWVNSLAGGGTVTDSNLSTSTVTVDGSLTTNSSVFGGVIQNGAGIVALALENFQLTVTAQNTFTGGTVLNDGRLYLGDATTNENGMIVGSIESQDVDDVYIYVAAGMPETFTGYIFEDAPNSDMECQVTKNGPGTLIVSPSQQTQYSRGTTIEQGTFELGNAFALPVFSATEVTVTGGATFNLGGVQNIPPLAVVTLTDGIVTNGTLNLAANGSIEAGYGEIDANVSGPGPAELDKVQYTGSANIPGIPLDTVIVGNSSNLGPFTTVEVSEGTLTVNGTLGAAGSAVLGLSLQHFPPAKSGQAEQFAGPGAWQGRKTWCGEPIRFACAPSWRTISWIASDGGRNRDTASSGREPEQLVASPFRPPHTLGGIWSPAAEAKTS